MIRLLPRFLIGLTILAGVLGVWGVRQRGELLSREPDEVSSKPAAIEFARDIQPILARCVQCHGGAKKEGGLSLVNRLAATGAGGSGERAIVPGAPDNSELLRRVSSTEVYERMPPKGEPLSPAQIETLRQWIAAGAEWEPHWAYRSLRRPKLPGGSGNARTPVDLFVQNKLAERKLAPSPAADKRTLLRRVCFDMIGLPPTPDDMAAFLADESPDAYERVVDRLLASPRFGERWARHWMDVVHFAETHGHDQDRPRPNAWPYRDYLIQSFNADKPYARFVEEQIAGDVLYPADPQAIVATGFLATGPWDESSLRDIRDDTIDRQIARYLDRDDIVTTVMSTFVSTTVHCARCHNHKFDPISQADYYNLQAVFAATDKAERAYDPDPAAAARRRELLTAKTKLGELRTRLDPTLFESSLAAEIAEWEKQVASAASLWQVLDPAEFKSEHGATLTKLPDGSILSGGNRPEKDTVTIVARTELPTITGLRLEVLTDDSLPHKGAGRQDNGNLHLSEFVVTTGSDAKRLELQNARADFDQSGWTIAMALDGNPGTAWGIFPEVGKPHRAVFELKQPLRCDGPTTLTIQLQQLHGGGHLIGRPRLSVTSAPLPLPLDAQTLPAAVATVLSVPAEQRTPEQRADLAVYFLEQKFDRLLAAIPPPQLVYAGTSQFKPDGSFKPTDKPRPVHLLARGDIHKPGAEAVPATLGCLPDLSATLPISDAQNEGERRAALARWIGDPRNGLTWRSIVNRVWHYHFGRGLVDTPNDFGLMGGAPTHPELLDWLAMELADFGDLGFGDLEISNGTTRPSQFSPNHQIPNHQTTSSSLKRLHRLMVTSSIYRQSSQHRANCAEIDADNRYLWRMNRSRLDAEAIHDAVAQISEQIDWTMGGPSVKQFIQTPGIHVTPNVDYQNFNVDDLAHYRRSVYRFIFRTIPDPFMETLDCADSSQLTPARSVSVTALQALSMLNDKFIVRQCEHVAARIASQVGAADGDADSQVSALFERTLNRAPTPHERAAFRAYIAQHGLANACRVLLNSNEFMFVN